MKCQILFSGKTKKKYFSMSSAEIFTQHAKGRAFCSFSGHCLQCSGPHLQYSGSRLQFCGL